MSRTAVAGFLRCTVAKTKSRTPATTIVKQCRSYASSSGRHADANPLPDLSHPKWKYREKLRPLNFANKGKSGFRQGNAEDFHGPTPSRREQEALRWKQPEEALPPAKTDPNSKAPESDPVYRQLYEAICEPSGPAAAVSPARLHSLPGKLNPQLLADLRVPLLDSSAPQHKLLAEMKSVQREFDLALLEADPNVSSSSALSSFSSSTSTLASTFQVRARVTNESRLVRKEAVEAVAQNEELAASPLNAHIAQKLLPIKDTFREVPHRDFTTILALNARLGKTKEAEQTFALIQDAGIEPSVEDYNQLMAAYSTVRDLPNCLRVFEQLKRACNQKQNEGDDRPSKWNQQPNVKSYGILIHCLAVNRKLVDAFRIYEEMKLQRIPVTQPIVTSLLKGCSLVGDYNRAWRFFEHVRNELSRPDELTYNHMIHICAKTGHVERAFTLYQEMLRSPSPDGNGNLYPLETTFLSLIHACSRRPDYYREVFDLVSQMEEAGFRLNRLGYNYLLSACVQQGDIQRAKALWKEMSEAEGTTEDLRPDAYSHIQLLQCYSRTPALVDKLWRKTVWRKQMDRWNQTVLASKMGLENEERMKQGLRPIDINEWMTEENYNPDEKIETEPETDVELEELRGYLMEGQKEDTFLETMRSEALEVIRSLKKRLSSQEESFSMTTNLMNSYVDVLGAFGMKREAMQVFEQGYAEYGVEWNEQTFLSVLRSVFREPRSYSELEQRMGDWEKATKAPDAANAFLPTTSPITTTTASSTDPSTTTTDAVEESVLEMAWKVYGEFEKFRVRRGYPNHWHELETKYVRNKWQEKGITHAQRKQEYLIHKYMIAGLTRYEDLHRATRLLEVLIDRGHAKVTNLVHVQPDTYAPSTASRKALQRHEFVENQRGHMVPLPQSPEVDRELFHTEEEGEPRGKAEEDSSLVTTDDASRIQRTLSSVTTRALRTRLGQKATTASPSDTPRYVQPPVEFRYSDFVPLLHKAQSKGMVTLHARVHDLLERGKRDRKRDEEKAVERLKRNQRMLRKRWYGK